MSDDFWLKELAQEKRDQESESGNRLDERWDRLSAGTLSPEEEAELRALAETSEEAREAYEAFRPLGADFQARVVQAIREQSCTRKYGMMDEWSTQDEVRAALAGSEAAQTRLVRKLTPVIQSRVARGLRLWRTGMAAGRDIRQEVPDLTQEVFLTLFANEGKVLRSWQPELGLSLLNFVGLVAERRTASILRNGKRSPWKEDPTLPEDFDTASPESDPEEIIASREEFRLVVDRLTEELSPLGRHLFDLHVLRELTAEEMARETGMSLDAVYQWRSRLRRLVRRLLDEMSKRRVEPRRPLRGEA